VDLFKKRMARRTREGTVKRRTVKTTQGKRLVVVVNKINNETNKARNFYLLLF